MSLELRWREVYLIHANLSAPSVVGTSPGHTNSHYVQMEVKTEGSESAAGLLVHLRDQVQQKDFLGLVLGSGPLRLEHGLGGGAASILCREQGRVYTDKEA